VLPDAITLQWWFVDTVLERSSMELLAQELVVPAGRSRVLKAAVSAAS